MSAPTKAEVDEAISRMEREQGCYRQVGNHNRAIARERISKYQERKFYAPNHMQMSGTVRGGDRYDSNRFPWVAFVVLAVLAAAAILVVRTAL